MDKPVLVIMAAGMGSRYGGLKQIDPVDEQGNIIMDFSIYDAVKAGFGKVVFIIKHQIEEEFKRSIGLGDQAQAIPAGVMYLSSNISLIDIDDYIDADEVMKRASAGVERTGVILNEQDILLAMNRELDANFLAGVKKNKDGALKGDALASADTFADIYERLEKVIEKFAGALYSGNADARPQRHGKSIPCTYCEARPICRKMNENGGKH